MPTELITVVTAKEGTGIQMVGGRVTWTIVLYTSRMFESFMMRMYSCSTCVIFFGRSS